MQPRQAGESPRRAGDRERARGALIESLGVYRRLHDGAGVAIDFVIDFIRSTRRGGEEVSAALVGKTLCNALPDDLANAIRDGFERALASGKAERFDLSIDRRTVEVTAVPRTPSEVIATCADVTEARLAGEKLAREEIRFRRIVDAVHDYAIYMLDPEGRVASWNAGAARIKGYRADEILGRHFSRFYTPEDIATKLPDRELVDAQRFGRFEGEGWRIRKDGTRFWANVIISPIRDADGTLLGFTKVTRDLTARVEAEENARRLAAETATARRLEAIQRVSDAALAHPELDELLNALVSGVRDLLHVDEATIVVLDPRTQTLIPTASTGLEDEIAEKLRIPVGRGIAGRVAATRQPLVLSEIGDGDAFSETLRAKVTSIAAVPLVVDDRLIGVLHVGSRERRDFASDEVTLLRMIADRAAWAIDRAHTYAVLAESEERFRSTFEYAAVGIAHFGADGTLLRANESLQKMLGYDEAYLKDHFTELSHPDNPGPPEIGMRVFRGEIPSGVFEKRYVRADGSTLWARVTVSLARAAEAEPRYMIALLEDVTERREHEERMKKLLAREQAAVAEQVRARQQMEEALRGRDVFLAIAAHELRTPLTPMRLQVDAILRDLREPLADPERHARFLKKFRVIERQTHRLEALVSNLLDTSRIASGQLELHFEPVAVDDLVRRVVHHYESDAASSGCTLEVTVTPDLVATTDRARVEQIVANLVSNAIRYGAAKPVRVSATREGSQVRIVVCDEGIGVADDDQRRIFERFERAASERHYGGLGLGLWITRQIVDALGGRIRIESALGKGSCFIVTLPVEHEPSSGGT